MQTQRKKSMTTKAGTELPILDLRGKDYLQVAHRLVWFREEHPDWAIKTLIVERTPDSVIIRAEIYSNEGKLMASAHKAEDKKGFPDFLEKGETGAVGRALAMCGYGTQFAPDLDEEERLADSPIARPVTSRNVGGTAAKTVGVTSPGVTATKPASPSKALPPPGGKPAPAPAKKVAETTANFDDFPGGPFNN